LLQVGVGVGFGAGDEPLGFGAGLLLDDGAGFGLLLEEGAGFGLLLDEDAGFGVLLAFDPPPEDPLAGALLECAPGWLLCAPLPVVRPRPEPADLSTAVGAPGLAGGM
jgi:hypothetical protein